MQQGAADVSTVTDKDVFFFLLHAATNWLL